MFFLFVILGIFAYIAIGALSARVQFPSIVEYAKYTKGDSYEYLPAGYRYVKRTGYREIDGIDRKEIFYDIKYCIFLWPYDIPYTLIANKVDKAIDKVDPEVYARSQERVKELERELGMR